MAKKKLSKSQVEKILTAHGLGLLMRGGRTWYDLFFQDTWCNNLKGCINQIVYNIAASGDAFFKNRPVAEWFDQNYDPAWTPEQFLDAMGKAGLF